MRWLTIHDARSCRTLLQIESLDSLEYKETFASLLSNHFPLWPLWQVILFKAGLLTSINDTMTRNLAKIAGIQDFKGVCHAIDWPQYQETFVNNQCDFCVLLCVFSWVWKLGGWASGSFPKVRKAGTWEHGEWWRLILKICLLGDAWFNYMTQKTPKHEWRWNHNYSIVIYNIYIYICILYIQNFFVTWQKSTFLAECQEAKIPSKTKTWTRSSALHWRGFWFSVKTPDSELHGSSWITENTPSRVISLELKTLKDIKVR